jgi:hypothetical protein
MGDNCTPDEKNERYHDNLAFVDKFCTHYADGHKEEDRVFWTVLGALVCLLVALTFVIFAKQAKRKEKKI